MSFWSRLERRLSDIAGDLLPDDVRDHIESARKQLLDGDPESAADQLQAIVDARPNHVGALSLLGLAELERNQPKRALEIFDRVVAMRPDLPDAQVGRGQTCLTLHLDDEAIDSFRAAVEHASGEREILALAYRGLGIAHRRRGDLDKAIRELRKAVAESPTDAIALAALGEALFAHQEVSNDEARKYLNWALEQQTPPPAAHLTSAELALLEGDYDDAELHFTRAAEDAEALGRAAELAAALAGSGRVAALRGDLLGANERTLRALELAPDDPGLQAALGDLKARSSSPEAALGHYRRALELGAGDEVLRRAIELAADTGELETANELALQLLQSDPDDPAASIARARYLASSGELETAAAAVSHVLERAPSADAYLARAELAQLDDDSVAAAGDALEALKLEPHHRRARELLREVREAELPAPARGDLRAAFAALETLVRERLSLNLLGSAVARAVADYDRPLMVTVMGEFSSGKSSFVNAFIGADVAPTGITPTTATINVVRHGRERRGLLVYLDGRTEEVEWDELFDRLRGLGEVAREIARVEIMLPLDILERVNLVDTPGLNSILPEHEEVARGFIARADAVVWLFSAQQAGKASEREALASIRDQGVRVLGVLNKVDTLAPGDVTVVEKMLVDELGEYIEAVVPVSARRALEEHPESNWEALEATLQERFFDSAQNIKDQVARRRIAELVDEVREIGRGVSERIADLTAELETAVVQTREQIGGLGDRVVTERREIALAVGELYRQASREVVELVLPRRLPFGSNKATPADRDYLISLLETGLEAALGHSRARIDSALGEALVRSRAAVTAAGALLGGRPEAELSRAFADAVELLDAQVYASALAYLRGYLRGGYVEQFFRNALPKLDIAEDAIFHALYRDAPDVDALIARPLDAFSQRVLEVVIDQLAALSGALSVYELDFELGALAPAELIADALAEP